MGKGAQNCLELLKTRWENLIASNPNEEENLMAAEKVKVAVQKNITDNLKTGKDPHRRPKEE